MTTQHVGRRSFLAIMSFALLPRLAAAAGARRERASHARRTEHPTPRPGITAAGVLTANQLKQHSAAEAYARVREIPQVVDGIHCHCGCATLKGFYSLLTCYEAGGMAQYCDICQGEAMLVYKLHREGWSLNGIRASVDAAFGSAS